MTNLTTERVEAKLNALSEAVAALTTDLSLDRVLRRLAEIAAQLVNARYAALGVPDGKGGLKQFFTYGMTEEQVDNMDHYPLGHGLLGLLITDTQPIRLEDMRKDPRSAGFCAHHPRMTSFLGVPIMSKGNHLGSLYLSDRLDGQPFSEDDERMISLLAGHAAIAIENANLLDQTQRLAVIEERDRISMELHDGIIQAIYAIGIKLELARLTLVQRPEVAEQIISANEDLNRVIEDLRKYVRNLRAGVEHSVTLREQLEKLADNFRQVSNARLVMDISQGFAQLSEDRIHAIVQIVRESLSNIVRHANASEVYLDLHETPTQITLVISDNGQGFDPEKVLHGNGLHNIQQRARQIGGTVNVTSRVGRGTTLTVIIPL
ncbi:MAG: GAF domain-containing sensor histidine kinase [Anaerolineae bacterium]|nr:GAF domain-containing sensor histidine kinase [Anaerolineae bacterium]